MTGAYIFLWVFIFVFIVLVPIGFVTAYSLKGRRFVLRLSGNKILRDYDIFSDNRFFGTHQTLRLLECEKKGKHFFIIEESARFTRQGGLGISWLKLDDESMQNLVQLLSQKSL